jgi:hypothetical protein
VQDAQRDPLELCRAATRVALIGDNLSRRAIERWYAVQSDEDPEPKSPERHADFMKSHIELLFSTLEMIRGFRQEDLLNAEAEKRKATASLRKGQSMANPVDTFQDAAAPEPSTIDTESSLDMAATLDLIVENLVNISKILHPSPLVEKCRKQLEEWSIEAPLKERFTRGAERAEIRKVQEAIAEKLGKKDLIVHSNLI